MSRGADRPACRRPCILAICATAALPLQAATAADEAVSLEPVVVSTTRTETPVSELTRSVTVVPEEEIQRQAELDRNLSSILAKTVPGLGPSTQAVTRFGQNLRGQDVLVLIDGIPQSTPLRDADRDLNSIDPAMIERIEVVRGGTAAYGFGATGGLINIITKKPSAKEREGYSKVEVSASTEHEDSSGDFVTSHRISGTKGQWQYMAAGSFLTRGGDFDSEGRRIPPDPLGAQGGFSDSDQYDLMGKLGYEFDGGNQRLDFMINDFEVEQDTDFVGAFFFDFPGGDAISTVDSDPLPNSRRTPAIPVSEANPGSGNDINPGGETTLAQLQYSNRRVFGGTLEVDAYWADRSVVFSKFVGFPQSGIDSEKFGTRVTLDTPVNIGEGGASIIWGADFLRDETSQTSPASNTPPDVPDMEQDAYAVFGELRLPVGEDFLLRGGLRHEIIEVDTDRVVNQFGNTVRAGTLEFDETLANISGVWYFSDSAELFASASQGFSIADIGRVIRDAGSFSGGETLDAEQFESDANKVDNFEVGVRGGDRLRYEVAVFRSEADGGTTFGADPQRLDIRKLPEEVEGLEVSLDYTVNDDWTVGGSAAYADGERETLAGDKEDLPNTSLSPETFTLRADYTPAADWEIGGQVLRVGDRDPDCVVFGCGEVDAYTLVDLTARVGVGPGDLRLSVQNLFNEDYFPAVNQAFDTVSAFGKGPGRTIGASYDLTW